MKAYPGSKGDSKKSPLPSVDHLHEPQRIRRAQHRRLEGGKACTEIAADGHAVPWLLVPMMFDVRALRFDVCFIVHDELLVPVAKQIE